MKVNVFEEPRVFAIDGARELKLSHCGNIQLNSDEQVTFVTDSGTELDVVKKSWGYYATPSVNRRLIKFHLRASLCEGKEGARYVLLVEDGQAAEFQSYLEREDMHIVAWLDELPSSASFG